MTERTELVKTHGESCPLNQARALSQEPRIEPPVIQTAGSRGVRITSDKPGTPAILKREGSLLLLSTGIITLASLMPWLKGHGLWPDIPCLFNKITGLPCLTCGLTRSLSLSARGDFYAAFRLHLLGPPLFLLLFPATAYLLWSTLSGTRLRVHLSNRERKAVLGIFLGILIACWVIKIFVLKGG